MDERPLGPHSVSPVGLGAMRLAGPNVFGPPRNRSDALAVLREAVDRGVDHIDTAQFYGPDVVNDLIRATGPDAFFGRPARRNGGGPR